MNAYSIPGIQKDTIQHTPESAITLILGTIYHTTLQSVCIRSRKAEIKNLRQCVQVVLSNNTKYSFERIGQLTGHRNHATIIHAKRRVTDAQELFAKHRINSDLLRQYNELEKHYRALMNIEPDRPRVTRSYNEDVAVERNRMI